MINQPSFWLIAGPNGAGKTTLARRLLPEHARINTDDIAAAMTPDAPDHSAVAAARQTLLSLEAALLDRSPVFWETTLSGTGPIRMMLKAKANGRRIGLIYIGLNRPEVAVARVAERVRRGGHSVPESDIRRRYSRSLANLAHAIQISGVSVVLENRSRSGPTILATYLNTSRIFTASPLPDWLAPHLP
ncbi:MAG: AAA family ATPase [Rhodospirillaceae bacterium]|nr:AAA family ATPase [Rhodospirillaceae bacterium]MBT6137418.1 AAA family ATPase [Rhodospirillaceae bacterium]